MGDFYLQTAIVWSERPWKPAFRGELETTFFLLLAMKEVSHLEVDQSRKHSNNPAGRKQAVGGGR